MKIPKSFKLGGLTITTKYEAGMNYDRARVGEASYMDSEITLLNQNEANPVPDDLQGKNYCHEVAHHISFYTGAAVNHELKESLHKNEEFVDLLGLFLHQFLTTAEYDK